MSNAPFVVGANFPWIDCGWDFGTPPPGWTRSPARDWSRVERDLTELRALGITVVRWWVLAGGVNYPVGESIETIARLDRPPLGQRPSWELVSDTLPRLPESFVADFAALCRAATLAGVQLLPSLMSFEFFDRSDGTSRGRRSLVMGRAGEHHQLAIERFLTATLDPLLTISREHARAIYAWEVINEPDWVVRGGPPHLRVAKTVSYWEMDALIFLAVKRIEQAGFVATVGFKQAKPRWVQPYLWDFLRGAVERKSYLHQLHHYPTLVSDRTLAPADEAPLAGTVVGEFPTGDERALLSNAAWGDRGLRERDPQRYLEARLALIRERGYGGAFLWCSEPEWIKARRVKNGGELEPDPRVRWTTRQRAQVERFTRALGVPPVGVGNV